MPLVRDILLNSNRASTLFNVKFDENHPAIPSLERHEIIGEKVRAASQRSRVRDLHDRYPLAGLRFDRTLVRQIAELKWWETNFALDPTAFLAGVEAGHYDWSDLHRLLKKGREIQPSMIIHGVQKNYAYLNELRPEERLLAEDPYQRQKKVYRAVLAKVQNAM
jgi:predicted nucleotidyltransferase component of viral defense system